MEELIFESYQIFKIKEWKTLNGFSNASVQVKNKEYKFEIEEAKQCFNFRIEKLNLQNEDEGTWKCEVKLWLKNQSLIMLENSKKINLNENSSEILYVDPLKSVFK